LLLYIERRHGDRYVAELAELRGYNAQTDTYDIVNVYEREFAVAKDTTTTDLAAIAAAELPLPAGVRP
jgi:hypothetical protein